MNELPKYNVGDAIVGRDTKLHSLVMFEIDSAKRDPKTMFWVYTDYNKDFEVLECEVIRVRPHRNWKKR